MISAPAQSVPQEQRFGRVCACTYAIYDVVQQAPEKNMGKATKKPFCWDGEHGKWCLISSTLRVAGPAGGPGANVVSVKRVQHRRNWMEYVRFRDEKLAPRSEVSLGDSEGWHELVWFLACKTCV
jgi:hypothetical protein